MANFVTKKAYQSLVFHCRIQHKQTMKYHNKAHHHKIYQNNVLLSLGECQAKKDANHKKVVNLLRTFYTTLSSVFGFRIFCVTVTTITIIMSVFSTPPMGHPKAELASRTMLSRTMTCAPRKVYQHFLLRWSS